MIDRSQPAAPHAAQDPPTVVAEMVRVTRPSGRIGIVDIVLADPDTAAENTRLERLRDPSHGRTLATNEIEGLLQQAGAEIKSVATIAVERDLEDWMERSHTPEATRVEIRDRLDDELAGGHLTGLRPHHRDGARTFIHPWSAVVATPTNS